MIGHNTTLTHCNWGARYYYHCMLLLVFMSLFPGHSAIAFMPFISGRVVVSEYQSATVVGAQRLVLAVVVFLLLVLLLFFFLPFIFYLHMIFRFIIWNESEYVRLLFIFSNCFNETFSSLCSTDRWKWRAAKLNLRDKCLAQEFDWKKETVKWLRCMFSATSRFSNNFFTNLFLLKTAKVVK